MIMNTSDKPLVSVVVCTYNRSALLRSCLDSLAVQSADRAAFEVLVVDNNSTDDTFEVAGSFSGNFRVIRECRQGLSVARNRGWVEARGGYVAYIDDDAKAYEGWIQAICDFAARRPEVKAFGGPYDPFYLYPPPAWFPPEYGGHDLGREERPVMLGREWITGSNMAFRKDVLPGVGGFDENLGMNGTRTGFGEETNLLLKVKESGGDVWYVPSMRVSHLVRPEKFQLRYLLAGCYHVGRNHCLTFRIKRSLGNILLSLMVTAVKAGGGICLGWRRPFKRTLFSSLSPLLNEAGALVEYFRGNKGTP